MLDILGPVFPLEYHVRLFKAFLYITLADVEQRILEDVLLILLVHQRRFQCVVDGVHSREFLVFYFDRFQSILYQRFALCRHHCHTVSGIADTVCQVHVPCPALCLAKIGECHHRLDAFYRLRLICIDPCHPRTGIWAS